MASSSIGNQRGNPNDSVGVVISVTRSRVDDNMII